jgi:hypothetical protein
MRYLFLLLLLWNVTLSAHAAFAPVAVNHVPTKEERTEGNTVPLEIICKKQHGEWFEGNGYAYCVLPYADAGKVCNSSKDCIGHCIAPVTDKPVNQGTCQINDEPNDCGRPHYENGKVIYFNCD